MHFRKLGLNGCEFFPSPLHTAAALDTGKYLAAALFSSLFSMHDAAFGYHESNRCQIGQPLQGDQQAEYQSNEHDIRFLNNFSSIARTNS
jgi:hypothetical protein